MKWLPNKPKIPCQNSLDTHLLFLYSAYPKASSYKFIQKIGGFLQERIGIVFLGVCVWLLGMALGQGLAAEVYPSRALTMIVPFPPDHAFLLVPAQAYVGQFLTTFKDFPPSQKPASFSIDQIMQKMQEGVGSK